MRWRAGVGLAAVSVCIGAMSPALAQEPAAAPAGGYGTALNAPARLAERVGRILEDPALARAHVGLVVQVAETGEVLLDVQGDKLFVPASNTKIVTAAVALDVLGPEYRWTTELVTDGPVEDGVLEGDLWIIGGGDPWLSPEALAAWPELLASAGIRRIAGDVIGDDRRFEGPQWGEGWYWHEVYAAWGAGISALQVRPNTVRAQLVPGTRVGDPARFELRREGPGIPLLADVRTGAPGSEVRLHYERPP